MSEILLYLAVLAGNVPAEAPRDNGIIAVRTTVDKAMLPVNDYLNKLTKVK